MSNTTTTTNGDDGRVEHIMDLTIEVGNDADDGFLLEQDCGSGEKSRMYLQRLHVERLALHAGLITAPDPQAHQYQKTVTTLVRRLRVLFDRINELDEYLHKYSDTAHANMEWEQHFSFATWQIAQEFCFDVDDLIGKSNAALVKQPPAPAEATPVQAGSHAARTMQKDTGEQLLLSAGGTP